MRVTRRRKQAKHEAARKQAHEVAARVEEEKARAAAAEDKVALAEQVAAQVITAGREVVCGVWWVGGS